MDWSIEAYQSQFGKKFEYSYEIEELSECSKKDRETLIAYQDWYALDQTPKDAVEIEYKLTVFGNGYSGETWERVVLLKLGNTWYIVDSNQW